MVDTMEQAALRYHLEPVPGKLAIQPTKPLSNQQDLALAYSPGVAYACMAIANDNRTAADYTARGNLVGVISNGTAVLGLGAIGPLAGKPVMEGKRFCSRSLQILMSSISKLTRRMWTNWLK